MTFLVRSQRAAELNTSGLRIRSRYGDVSFPHPRIILTENLRETVDLVLLSCKAYDLEDAIASFAPAVGPDTVILPLLNGMRHLDILDERFGPQRVLGGQCLIAVSLNEERVIVHLNDTHEMSFGERDGTLSDRVKEIASSLGAARFDVRSSTEIILEMWAKWVFLASLAASTCLMRATIGDIAAATIDTDLVLGLLEECGSIAAAEDYQVPQERAKRARDMLTAPGSALTASMLRDIERNAPIEAEHIIGDLLRRGHKGCPSQSKLSLLGIAYTHLKAYEARRARILSSASTG